jgi:hypothetical protein
MRSSTPPANLSDCVSLGRPMVYGGECSGKATKARFAALGWGQCITEGPWTSQTGPFILDNGAFVAWRQGKPFPAAQFMRRVEKCYARGLVPDFAVLPDVVADPAATLELSAKWYAMLPAEWPKAFVLQDGIQTHQVAAFLKDRPCTHLFLGGTDWFKDAKAAFWCDWAHARGMKFHFGRAGTPRKFEFAMLIGADSLDSARLSRDGQKWSDFARCKHLWLKGGHPRLFAERGAA